MADLHAQGLLSNSYWSYCESVSGEEDSPIEVDMIARLRWNRSQFVTGMPYVSDELDQTQRNDHSCVEPKYHVNAYCNIVLESQFDVDQSGGAFVTEKTFKPMAMKQPFMIFAGPGTLQYLKNYGFRTFDCVWDESYDLEQDHDTRLEKVINIINDLSRKSDQEFGNIINKCTEIVDHNHQHFFSDVFEKMLLDELHSNMKEAIKKQQRKTCIDPGGSFFHAYDSMLRRKISIPFEIEQNMKHIIDAMKSRYPERYQLVKRKYLWC
jgi:hypothetical protein